MGECECFTGWSGEDRRVPINPDEECNSASTCSANGRCSSAGECTCYDGWNGKDCSVPATSDPGSMISICNSEDHCNANGRCNGITGTCICYKGWSGQNCSMQNSADDVEPCARDSYGACLRTCESETKCNANGRCNGKTGECLCYAGWSGEDCSIPITLQCQDTDDKDPQCGDDHYDTREHAQHRECVQGFSGRHCDCQQGSHVFTVPVHASAYPVTISVTMLTRDGDDGYLSTSSFNIIGAPRLLDPIRIDSCSFSEWSFEWIRPDLSWLETEAQVKIYHAQIRCGE